MRRAIMITSKCDMERTNVRNGEGEFELVDLGQ
jgi:hypothetical protein